MCYTYCYAFEILFISGLLHNRPTYNDITLNQNFLFFLFCSPHFEDVITESIQKYSSLDLSSNSRQAPGGRNQRFQEYQNIISEIMVYHIFVMTSSYINIVYPVMSNPAMSANHSVLKNHFPGIDLKIFNAFSFISPCYERPFMSDQFCLAVHYRLLYTNNLFFITFDKT